MTYQFQTLDRERDVGLLARGWPWLAVAAVGLTVFFWYGLVSLGAAWQRPEYSYGPMVPVITLLMTLRELSRRPPVADDTTRLPGLVVLAAGMLIGLLGNLAHVADITTYGFILAVGGFFLIIAGTRQGLRFWPGWVHLFFMLPLPQFIYLHVSTYLQWLSSRIGVGLIDAMGIPVYLDGNIIDLGVYRLEVAEACSGLNYLFPMLSFSWLVALLYAGPNWHRVVIFLSSIPITLMMNALRIGIIGILVSNFGIGHAEGFIHAFEGWVVFMVCTALLYGEAWLLMRFASGGRSYPGVLDLDMRGLLTPLKDVPRVAARGALIFASLLVLAAGLAWQAQPETTSESLARRSLTLFPLALGQWQGQMQYLDAPTLRVLAADDHLTASYVSGTAQVDLLLTYYNAQTGTSGGVHSPEVCLPAGGWEVSTWSRQPVTIGGDTPHSLSVNRAVIRKGSQKQLVYYWFEQRGQQTPSEYEAKFMALRDAISIGRSDGGLVRLVTPIDHSEDEAAADRRLAQFMQRVVPILPAYFPPS